MEAAGEEGEGSARSGGTDSPFSSEIHRTANHHDHSVPLQATYYLQKLSFCEASVLIPRFHFWTMPLNTGCDFYC